MKTNELNEKSLEKAIKAVTKKFGNIPKPRYLKWVIKEVKEDKYEN